MLSPLQKAQLFKANPNAGMLLLLQRFEQEYKERADSLKEEFSQKLEEMQREATETFQSIKQIQKGDKGESGRDGIGIDGKDGATPTREELIALIQPLIPKIKDGHTPTREEMAEMMKPLLPNEYLIMEKVLTQIKLPESPTAEAIADLVLEKLKDKKFTVEEIEGLQNILNTLNRNIAELKGRKLQGGGGGGGMSEPQHEQFACNGVLTSFTLGYKVAYGKAILGFYQGQQISLTTHYTVSGNVITTTFVPDDGTTVEFIYWRK